MGRLIAGAGVCPASFSRMSGSYIESTHGPYELSTDPGRIDIGAVHEFLSTDGYWSVGRSRDVVERSIANSGLVCGAYLAESGELVGFARMVTDLATFAWLCDVFVIPEHRGSGLGVAVVMMLVEHPALVGVKRQLLATRDAHELYRRVGFAAMAEPEKWMERAE